MRTPSTSCKPLADGGLRFGGLADDEGKYPDRWKKVETALGPLLFRWKTGCIEQNIIAAVPDAQLEALLIDPVGKKTGARLRSLADRLGMKDKNFATLKGQAGPKLRTTIVEAAMGTVPEDKADDEGHYKSHAQAWFKSFDGGRELASKLSSLGMWPTFQPVLMPFCNAVREALDLPAITDFKL